jgi:hypothetical protein
MQQVVARVKTDIYLWNFSFTKSNFETLIKSAHKCEKLTITFGNFSANEEFDFSGPKYSIRSIYFWNSALFNAYNFWDTHPERFENIIKGIKKSELKDSLRKIDTKDSGLDISQVQRMLNNHGLFLCSNLQVFRILKLLRK